MSDIRNGMMLGGPSHIRSGVRLLGSSHNRILLIKWWWRFHTAPQLQWVKIIRALYYQRKRPLQEENLFEPLSYWLKGVLLTNVIFKWGSSYMLGNESSIDFRTDRWRGETTLHRSFLEIHMMESKLLSVKDCFEGKGRNWNRILGDETSIMPELRSNLMTLKERVGSFKVEKRLNTIRWRWCCNGVFSIKSAYCSLSDGGTRDGRAILIWGL